MESEIYFFASKSPYTTYPSPFFAPTPSLAAPSLQFSSLGRPRSAYLRLLPMHLTLLHYSKGKDKRGGNRGGGKGFAAESAEEIEKRNQQAAEFNAARLKRRAEAEGDDGGDDDDEGDDNLGGGTGEREQMERGMAGMR